MADDELSQALLRWYDRNARTMAWRVGPAACASGVRPDPYQVWLSEIMLQQTGVAVVDGYFGRFIRRWPTVQALAAADDAQVMGEWAGLGYYARARNLLKCARLVTTGHGGQFSNEYHELLRLPGIGPYTAAAICAIAFGRAETVVDGNVERVMARMFCVRTPLPGAKPELRRHAARLTPTKRPGDYAQAVMDLGATICTVKAPKCSACPWSDQCRARAAGCQHELPRRVPKPPKPTRFGIAYLVRRDDGAWLLERRPDSGLLGGMLGWPGSDWGEKPNEAAPLRADWHDPGIEVRHTFTHFHLRLALRVAAVACGARAQVGQCLSADEFRRTDLPTVMRKAYDIATKFGPVN